MAIVNDSAVSQVFKSYTDFLQREDKKLNGVSEEFAALHPDFETQNTSNENCWNCSDCYGCSDCSGCSGCFGCSDCSDLKNAVSVESTENIRNPNAFPEIPVIENIHQKILQAVSQYPDSLNMSDWHTCDTTHCRAGWITFLAGDKGKKLEKHTSTPFAAGQIYKASSPIKVYPVRFYEDNEMALADIKRCAEEEAKQTIL